MAAEIPLPIPPAVPGHSWRAATPDDLPAIRELQLACAAVYDNPPETLVEYEQAVGELGRPPVGDTICAADAEGGIIALGWVRTDPDDPIENRTGLFGDVHPEYRRRGLGRFVLSWTEARGRQLLAAQAPGHAVLRVDFSDRRDDAVPLYERLGFRLGFHELWMRRDLRAPVPERPLPEGMGFLAYGPELAPLFVAVFNDSFSTRRPAGHPDLSLEDWREGYEADPDFRPHLTLLATEGEEGAGFVVGEVWPSPSPAMLRAGDLGWIPQLGVRPAWRGRGVASALLARSLAGFRAEGLEYAALTVNRDNPEALRLYERFGFERMGDRVMYRKDV